MTDPRHHERADPAPPADELFRRFGVLPNARSRGDLELRLRGVVRFLRLGYRELRRPMGLSLLERLKAWRHGFTGLGWVLYDLPDNDPAPYLGGLLMPLRSYRINGFANPIIGDKLVLSHLLTAHGLPHPPVLATIQGGRLYPADPPDPTDRADPPDRADRTDGANRLSDLLDRHPRLVFRPTWSGAGEGVFFVSARDGIVRLNGTETSAGVVGDLVAGLDRYLVTGFVDQAGYARRIFPDTTNTLRILTLWDDDAGEPFVAAVTHRFGSRRSAPLDNWHQGRGGVVASVDRATATLGSAVALTADNRLSRTAVHPDTGQPIEGTVVPGLQSCLDGLEEAAARFPFCPMVGWDVVITDSGHSIIEANPLPGLFVWQVHGPLLADPRTRAFFSRRGLGPRPGPETG